MPAIPKSELSLQKLIDYFLDGLIFAYLKINK